jgi:acyl homoserine lactone synthase
MINIIEPIDYEKHSAALHAMFFMRAHFFGKWVPVGADGLERDEFDDLGPVYMVSEGASLRLLPTTGPTLMEEAFADTKPDAAQLSAPDIWECSRFCAYEHEHSYKLMAAVGVLCLEKGINSVICNSDARAIDRWCHAGFEVELLGSTKRYGRPIYLGLFPITQHAVGRAVSAYKPVWHGQS